MTIVDGPADVQVGNLPGVQIDVDTGTGTLDFGATPFPDPPGLGVGPGAKVRVSAVEVGGRVVVVLSWLGPENNDHNFDAAVNGLQPILDSMIWGELAAGSIVFEDVGDNYVGTQVWIEDADGSNVRKLVSDDLTDGSVSLSPDGKTAVFYSTADPNALVARILLVEVDTGAVSELDTGDPDGCDDGPEGDAFSPDGTRIAFERFCFDANGSFVGGGIFTVGVDGSHVQQVTRVSATDKHEDHRASWSPDGKRLVFERIDTSVSPEKAAIFIIDADGMNERQVTPWDLDGNDPDWSPDGQLIVFNAPAESGGDQNIYVIAPDGSGLQRLTYGLSTWPDGGQATYHPTWSPDGSQILFSHAPATDGFADLFVMNRDGSDLHVLRATTLAENHATWGGGK
jgi:TolB protein